MDHECTIRCWDYGCDFHEVCTANACIPASVIAAEYRRQAETANEWGAALLRKMADEMDALDPNRSAT